MKKSGFTLIELLIVIGILSVLVVTILITLNPSEAQKKTRDLKRLKDIKTLESIVLQYISAGSPPVCEGGCNSKSAGSVKSQPCDNNWITGNASPGLCQYAQTIPVDPLNGKVGSYITGASTSSQGEFYYSFQMQGSDYKFESRLESKSNASSIAGDGGSNNTLAEYGTNLALAPSQTSEGLVGWWKFDDGSGSTTVDASGNGQDGTLVNGPLWQSSTTCRIGGCLFFDGVDDHVELPNSANLELRTGITISVWTRQNDPIDSTTQRTLAGKNSEAYLHVSYGQSRFTVHAQTDPGGCSVGYCQAMGGTILTPNTWYHLVGTFDGNTIKIYENGVLKNTRAWTATINNGSNRPYIGGAIWGLSKGYIDDVRIYNRALSDSEIQRIYGDLN